MRRMTLGLAAAAVIAGSVGFGGAAQAVPSYVSLGTNGNTLSDSSGNTWYVNSCTFGGTNGCSNFVMYNDGTGIGLAGAPGFGSGTLGSNGLPTLGSEIQPSYADVTVDLFEYTGSSFFSGSNTITSAHLTAVGTTNGGTATITAYYPPSGGTTSQFVIGLPGSGKNPSVSLTPTNTVEYSMDVPLTTGLVTVTYGTPVPAPGPLGLMVVGLLAAAVVRYRSVPSV